MMRKWKPCSTASERLGTSPNARCTWLALGLGLGLGSGLGLGLGLGLVLAPRLRLALRLRARLRLPRLLPQLRLARRHLQVRRVAA